MKKNCLPRVMFFLACFYLICIQSAFAATFTVNDLGDASDASAGNGTCATAGSVCTLRAAVEEANALSGADTIVFSVSGTISPASALILTDDQTTLNGGTNHDVVVNGTGTSGIHCLQINEGSDSNTLHGLVIQDCNIGVYVLGNSNHLYNNYVGTNTSGDSAVPNNYGIVVGTNGASNIIGYDGSGTVSAERNIFSGNSGWGVQLSGAGTGNIVSGNYIGTDVNGSTALANGIYGIYLSGGGNYIGTNGDSTGDADEGNVISGNTSGGVYLDGNTATGNKIAGNIIGLSANGSTKLTNATGIFFAGADSNIIGTDGDGISDNLEKNTLSGNAFGLYVSTGSNANKIAGNYIGLAIDGESLQSNSSYGVFLYDGATNNIIGYDGTTSGGSTAASERNIISGNSVGVFIGGDDSTGNRVAGNYIGTDKDGDTDLGNTSSGIFVANNYGVTTAHTIGTNSDGNGDADEGNVIAGNNTYQIQINGGNSITVAGNLIGINAAGTATIGGTYGVHISEGSNTIGTNGDGTNDAGERNTIGGCTAGIYLTGASATNNRVAGNYVGTNPAGTAALANTYGVFLATSSSANIIGTNGDGTYDSVEGNLISGNTSDGIRSNISNITNHIIAGNTIGLSSSGSDLGNGGAGINLFAGASDTRIGTNGDGTSDSDERNIISGNTGSGIAINGTSASTTIAGNYIGVGTDGTTSRANDAYGIDINATANNTIGGDASSEQNITAYNGTGGIYIHASNATNNHIQQNLVYGNSSFQISVTNDATTTPTVNSATAGASSGKIVTHISSTAGNTVSVYSDNSGSDCEARSYLGTATDNGDGSFSYITSNLAIGTKVSFQTRNGTSNSSALTCYDVVDLAPVLASIGAKSGSEAAALTFTVSAYDPNVEDSVSLSANNLPEGSSFTMGTGSFSWTPSYSQAGSYTTVTFVATESGSGVLTDTETITITISNTDTTPALTQPSSQSIAENTLLTFSLSGSDTDGDLLTYSCSNSCPSGLAVGSTTGSVSWTPSYSQAGSYNITFQILDPQGNRASQTVSLTVTNVNRAPSFSTTENRTVTKNSELSFTLTATDPDEETVYYQCASSCPSGLSINTANGTVTWTPTETGVFDVTFSATDTPGASGTVTLRITVSAPNTVTANAGADRTIKTNSTITLDGSSSSGSSLSYSWSLATGNGTLSDTTSPTPTFITHTTRGDSTVTLTVTDGNGNSAQDSVVIHTMEANSVEREELSNPVVWMGSSGEMIEKEEQNLKIGETLLGISTNDYTLKVTPEKHLVVGLPARDNGTGQVFFSDVPLSGIGTDQTLEIAEAATLKTSTIIGTRAIKTTATPDFYSVRGQAEGDRFGEFLTVGDLDGDQKNETIIGAPGAKPYGIAYVFDDSHTLTGIVRGSENHPLYSMLAVQGYLSNTDANLLTGPRNRAMNDGLYPQTSLTSGELSNKSLVLANLQAGENIDFEKDPPDATIGSEGSIRTLVHGDLNNDGQNDALFASNNDIFVFLGPINPNDTKNMGNADIRISGSGSAEEFGHMMALGDVTGDRLTDLVIGSPQAGGGTGSVFVVFGTSAWPGTIDVNTSPQVLQINGEESSDFLGQDLLLSDQDGDGIQEIYTLKNKASAYRLNLVGTEEADSGGGGCTLIRQ